MKKFFDTQFLATMAVAIAFGLIFIGLPAFDNWLKGEPYKVEVKKGANPNWHFHNPEGNSLVVSYNTMVLAKHFGPKVLTFARELQKVNTSNSFPSNDLLVAIAATESSFRRNAESSSSVGYLQINYKAHELDKGWVMVPENNIRQSIKVLRDYHSKCNGDLKCTLLSYNVGYRGYKEGKYDISYYNKVVGYLNFSS